MNVSTLMSVLPSLLNNSLIEVHRHFARALLYLQLHKRPQGLHSSTQMLKSPSTSYFKYFVIVKFSKFCKKDKCSVVVELLAGSCICTRTKLIKAKAISLLTFFFKNSFPILKLNLKAAIRVFL